MTTYLNDEVVYIKDHQIKEISGEEYFNIAFSLVLHLTVRLDIKVKPWRYSISILENLQKDIKAVFRLADDAGMPWTIQNKLIALSGVNNFQQKPF